MNRFKGLDLVERIPEELWTEVHNCTEGSDQNHPKEKEVQVGKMDVWVDFTNSWEKKKKWKEREKGKDMPPLNADFPRIARRDKKAFVNEQWKETMENNRMGKTRDFFKQTGDI